MNLQLFFYFYVLDKVSRIRLLKWIYTRDASNVLIYDVEVAW